MIKTLSTLSVKSEIDLGDLMELIDSILIIASGIALIVWELYRTRFINILKSEERSTWEELGKPTGFFLSFLVKANGFELEKFVYKKKYMQLSGSKIKNIGSQLYIVQLITGFVVAIFFVFILLNLVTFRS